MPVYSGGEILKLRLKEILKSNPITFITIFCVVAVSGIIFFYNKTVAIAVFVAAVLLSVSQIMWMNNTVKRKSQDVGLLNSLLADRGELGSELRNFPFPFVIADNSGRVEWYNNLFAEIIQNFSEYNGINIKSLFANDAALDVPDGLFSAELNSGKKKYTVYISSLEENLRAIYFVDDTSLKNIRKEYLLSRPAVLIIDVDSLDQAEDELDHEEYFALNANVDRLVSKWLAEYNCLFRKLSDGRFVAVTEKCNLEKMIAKKFDILDKVRDYDFNKQKTNITLSIGVGIEDTFRECEIEAREALDMCRDRGGDQTAIKDKDSGEYSFFGGMRAGMEKRGKIRSRSYATLLDERICDSDNVLVMGHNFGDFDCIGAAVGIAALAKARNISVNIIVNEEKCLATGLVESVKNEMPGLFITPDEALKTADNYTLLVITDTMRANSVECPELLNKNLRTFIVDHHRLTPDHIEGASHVYLEPNVSSACEMVTELIQYSPSKPRLSQIQAQALLAGIILDTKNYTLRTGVRTFQAAAYLRDCKADPVTVRKLFAGTAEETAEVNKIVTSAELHDNFAIAVADDDIKQMRLICSKAADELLTLNGVDASFVIYKIDTSVFISARSYGRINVQLIMERLGGGGHLSMAAAQLNCTKEEAKIKLINAINESFIDTSKNTEKTEEIK